MDLSNLGDLGKMAEQMQDAYGDGQSAMNQASEEVAKDIKPTHEIIVAVKLSAKVEGHDYKVDSTIVFETDLESILSAEGNSGDLSSLLDNLDVDLGDDKDAVMEQLGQPRAVGVVKKIDTKELVLSNKEGQIKTELNKKGTMLATLKDGKLLLNFEAVLSYPENTDAFIAIPSMEKMQENVVVDVKDLAKKVKFNWIEKDKDGLKIEGTVEIKEI